MERKKPDAAQTSAVISAPSSLCPSSAPSLRAPRKPSSQCSAKWSWNAAPKGSSR